MFYVYIIQSEVQPEEIYIGYTGDLKKRIEQHTSSSNRGYSKQFAPWKIDCYLSFSSEKKAKDFETCLKSSSGWAFMNKRLFSEEVLAKRDNPQGEGTQSFSDVYLPGALSSIANPYTG